MGFSMARKVLLWHQGSAGWIGCRGAGGRWRSARRPGSAGRVAVGRAETGAGLALGVAIVGIIYLALVLQEVRFGLLDVVAIVAQLLGQVKTVLIPITGVRQRQVLLENHIR